MTTRRLTAETRTRRTRKADARRDDQTTCEGKDAETSKTCLFKQWEAERREAAN